MTTVEGDVSREQLRAGLIDDPDAQRALGDASVDTPAALYSIDPEEVGLTGYGRPTGFVQRQVRRWSAQWHATTLVSAVEELAKRLEHTAPNSPAEVIVHGDYRLHNCIVDPRDPGRIAAVLDRGLSTLGHPLTDLGMHVVYWADAARVIPTLIQTVTDAVSFPTIEQVATRWSERTGLRLTTSAGTGPWPTSNSLLSTSASTRGSEPGPWVGRILPPVAQRS